MPKLSATSRCALLGALSLAALSQPARAQLFGATPIGDRQSLNLAGGSYLEGQWLPFTRVRFNGPAGGTVVLPDGTVYGAGTQTGLEEDGRAQASFGVEGRYVLPGVPWLFGTAEYRYERLNRARGYVDRVASDRVGIDRQNLQIVRVGAGVRAPGTPFYARAEFAETRVGGGNSAAFGTSGHDNGYGLHAGLAQPLTSWLGVRAEAGYQDLKSLGRGFAWQVGGNLNLTPVLALTAAYRVAQLRNGSGSGTGTRLQEISVGLRFQFAR